MEISREVIFLLIFWVSIVVIVKGDRNCDSLGINFYDKIGCPRQPDVDGCPSYADCKYKIPPGKCLFHGEVLSPGDNVKGDKPCFNCTCKSGGNIVCAEEYCPTGLIGPYRYYRYNNLEQCCGRFFSDNSSTITCEVDGKTYKENERFNSEHECFVCQCTKDFNGKFEPPACKRGECDIEVRHAKDIENNCAPVYYKLGEPPKALCCPITFICPSNEDNITTSSSAEEEHTCKYGDKIYKSNTVITRTLQLFVKIAVTCKCELPPLFTCIGDNRYRIYL